VQHHASNFNDQFSIISSPAHQSMPPRIFTFTPNPNLDRTLTVTDVCLDTVLRAVASRVDPGGKGFNVARALHALGIAGTALAFLGGDTGARLRDMMAGAGVDVQAVPVANETRTCYVVTDAAGVRHLKVNEPGPVVSEAEVAACFAAIGAQVRSGDLWVLAGSLPPGVEQDFYARLIGLLHKMGAHVVLDASGEALRLGLHARPFLVKPNALEAGEALGIEISTPNVAAHAAAQLCAMGVDYGAISLGAEGLVLAHAGESVHAWPPAVQARNTVGAGDAAVAGMLWALAQGLPLDEMARWSVACGTAAAMRPGTDFGPLDEVERVATQVRIEHI
jgi:1-phosphofructokinase family hexose kinase